MWSKIACAWCCCGAALLFAQTRGVIRPIRVQQRLALVIGNASYSGAPLVNPVRDAEAIATELRGMGFTVTTGKNLKLREFARMVDDFAGRLQSGDLALFYFAGHGMQVERENYLLPVDFEAASEADVPYAAYPADRVRDKLEHSGAVLRVMILDACRDNPYKTSRGGPRGLAPMDGPAEGTLIAFATGENKTASDNPGGGNGLFTEHLLAALREPGLELHDLFRRVKEEVYFGSNKHQNPATYDEVAGSFYFRAPAAAGEAALQAGTPTGSRPDSAGASPERRLANSTAGGRSPLRRVNQRDGLTYVWIPPGKFMMGCSPGDDECRNDEKPAHEVTISKGFWLGQTPVTVGAWKKYVRETSKTMPSEPIYLGRAFNPKWHDDRQPIVNVSWEEASAFCAWGGGRLPTEAEWEYAARAGSTGARYGDLDAIAWYADNSGKQRMDSAEILRTDQAHYFQRLSDNGNGLHPVGLKLPNAWKLYDMLGNVWQLTADWYDEKYYAQRTEIDPTGPRSGDNWTMRGGDWAGVPGAVRVSSRGVQWQSNVFTGLRCAAN